MEKITTPEFEKWAQGIVLKDIEKVVNTFKKFGITAIPTPYNIMLGAIKYKEPFIAELSLIDLLPEGIVYATGDQKSKAKGLGGFFEKALATAQGVGTAAALIGGVRDSVKNAASQPKPAPEPEEKEDKDYEIFGKKVPKVYAWLGGVFIVVTAFFLIKKFS